MCFEQDFALSVDPFIYIRSNISFAENDINILLGMTCNTFKISRQHW